MRYIIFLVLIFEVFGFCQRWQKVAYVQLQTIFYGAPFNLTAFYYARNMTEIYDLCELYSKNETNGHRQNYNSKVAAQECRLFFDHRLEVKKWMNEIFYKITRYQCSRFVAAMAKSYYWQMEALAKNDITDATNCFFKHVNDPFATALWKTIESAWMCAITDANKTRMDQVFAYAEERKQRFDGYGIGEPFVLPHICML